MSKRLLIALSLLAALLPLSAWAQIPRPFFVWNRYPTLDQKGINLPGNNPADTSCPSVPPGAMIQVLSVGIDGTISPPDPATGEPTGDDKVLHRTAIGAGIPYPYGFCDLGRFFYMADPLPSATPGLYARIFNRHDIEYSSHYGDSTVFPAAFSSTTDFDVWTYGLTSTNVWLKGTISPTPSPTPTASVTPSRTPTPSVPPTPVRTPSRVPTRTPIPSPSPTPAYCAEPFELALLEGLRLSAPRAATETGWSWDVVRASNPGDGSYGSVADHADIFQPGGVYPLQPVSVRFTSLSEPVNILEGDYLEVLFDEGAALNIYPPALAGELDVYYFVGADGSTYSDRWLCELAKAAPTASASPSASATPAPSATSSPSAAATPSASPTPSAVVTATPTPSASPSPSAATATPVPSATPTVIECLYARGQVRMEDSSPLPNGGWVRLVFPDRSSAPAPINPDGSYEVAGCTHYQDGSARIEARAPGCFPWFSQTDYLDWSDIEGVTVELTALPGRYGVGSADFDGDGRDDIAVFRPATGQWLVRGVTRLYYGREHDAVVPADYDGDGAADAAVFRGEKGVWVVRGLTRFYYGGFMDLPVPADYDGDGTAEAGIYRHADGLWAYRGAGRVFHGGLWDFPVAWREEGGFAPAIFRGASALWYVRGLTRLYFGREGDVPVAGAYAGWEDYVPAVFRPAPGRWFIRGLTRFYFGREGDIPLPAAGEIGDRPGLFRGLTGRWFIRGLTSFSYGRSGDQPVAR